MAKLSSKMNVVEREICRRLKQFRETLKISQPDFAKLIGITTDQLANIEYGKTPLRYGIAWNVMLFFGVGFAWLAREEAWPDDHFDNQQLRPPGEAGFESDALLSAVYERLHGKPDRELLTSRAANRPSLSLEEVQVRGDAMLRIQKDALHWFAQIPSAKVEEFRDKVRAFAEKLSERFPKEPASLWIVRYQALTIFETRRRIAKKMFWESEAGQKLRVEKEQLTSIHATVNTDDVRAQWPLLKNRLRKATAGVGMKSRLAEFLGVKLASVSQWLTDAESAREPGAETTLQMLRWVEQQERKQ